MAALQGGGGRWGGGGGEGGGGGGGGTKKVPVVFLCQNGGGGTRAGRQRAPILLHSGIFPRNAGPRETTVSGQIQGGGGASPIGGHGEGGTK